MNKKSILLLLISAITVFLIFKWNGLINPLSGSRIDISFQLCTCPDIRINSGLNKSIFDNDYSVDYSEAFLEKDIENLHTYLQTGGRYVITGEVIGVRYDGRVYPVIKILTIEEKGINVVKQVIVALLLIVIVSIALMKLRKV